MTYTVPFQVGHEDPLVTLVETRRTTGKFLSKLKDKSSFLWSLELQIALLLLLKHETRLHLILSA